MCTRREFLVGSVFGLTLADALAWGKEGKAKSCILVWLNGGPSHLETFDPKPEAPPSKLRQWWEKVLKEAQKK